jgi:TonB family protein
MASVTSHAQDARGALAGIVMDPSGARIPGSEVRAKNLDGSNQEVTKANAAGEYVFRSIPPGRYTIEVRARGFAIRNAEAVVTAGTASRADAALEIGEVSENVTVVGARAQVAAPAARAEAAQRIPIGGNVQAVKLLRQTRPVYPVDLQQQGVTGTVTIRAIVGKDGTVLSPQVLNTDVHPALAQAALDAVRSWIYEPSRLNGNPVETLTKITINFDLGQ